MIKTQCEQCKKYNTSCTENIEFNGQSCEQYCKRIDLEKKNKVSECEPTTIETTNVVSGENNLINNDTIINCIQEIGRHTKFLSIMGYVCLAFMGLGVIGLFADGDTGTALSSLLAIVGVYFIIDNLWKASKLYRDIASNKTIENLESGVKRMSAFWKTMAIIYKVYLIIIAIVFVIALFSEI